MSAVPVFQLAATTYIEGGFSIVPIRTDGSKRPTLSAWQEFQKRLPTRAEVDKWFRKPAGIGIICGAVSGNLETIDFDFEAVHVFPEWVELIKQTKPALLKAINLSRTPAGFHVRYRCVEPITGNVKLARTEDGKKCYIETRGEGGYALAPGSPIECNTALKPYEHYDGSKISKLKPISAEDRATLLNAARSFDRVAHAEHKSAGLPGDEFNARGPDWPDILCPHGWTIVKQVGNARWWRKPGKADKKINATTGLVRSTNGNELFCVFSTSAAPFPGPTGGSPCSSHNKFSTWCKLNANDDYRLAAKLLREQGYGEEKGDAWEGPSKLPVPKKEEPKQEFGTLLSAVKVETVDWLWKRRLAFGFMTILDGDPGTGKSMLTMDLVARLTTGRTFPDGGYYGPCSCVILNREDSPGLTIKPRLEAAGGDPNRVKIVEEVPVKGEKTGREPVLPNDVGYIAETIKSIDAKLLIVDPFERYLAEDINSNNNQEVRKALVPLAELARDMKICVLLTRHLNKGDSSSPIKRGCGGIAIIGTCRFGLIVAKDPADEKKVVLAQYKSNLGSFAKSLKYEILSTAEEIGYVNWLGESAYDASNILSPAIEAEDRSALEDAKYILRQVLGSRKVGKKDVEEQTKAAGVAPMTLRRAFVALQVKTTREGFGAEGTWYWQLPDDELKKMQM